MQGLRTALKPSDPLKSAPSPARASAASCRDCGIRDLVLFADLRDGDFGLIHQPIDSLCFAPGATLYSAGDGACSLFTIRAGLVKLVQFLPDGAQRIVRLLRPGAVAGLEVLTGGAFAHTAIALQPVTACRIPREVVDRLCRETPRLHSQLMLRWHQALSQADEWLTGLSTGSARQRVARLFLHLLAEPEEPAHPDRCRLFSREDVGAMLGITTETASRTVAEFKRQGLITEIAANYYDCRPADLERVAAEG